MRRYVGLGLLLVLVLALGVLAGGRLSTYAWTAPAALNSNAATDSGDDYTPQVTTDGGGNWVAVWSSYDTLGGPIGPDADILVARSTDNGASWTAPTALNTNAATDPGGDFDPEVATDASGNWVAVWRSYDSVGGPIGPDADILVARSTDNGASWTAPAALNTNAATDSRGDQDPQVTTDGAGNWLALWSSTENLDGIGWDADILVARSTDNGASWTDPTALNSNATTDSGGDLDPQVTTDGVGNWLAVWSSTENVDGIGIDEDILAARSTTEPTWPWTWTAPAALNSNATTDSGSDEAPQVTTNGVGNWVAVWHSSENLDDPSLGSIGTDEDILMARSPNNGATWTPPVALNTDASTDSGSDLNPQVTANGAGNWLAVWYSDENLDDPSLGPIGTDEDILVAGSPDNGASWTAPAALNSNAATDSGGDYGPQVTTDGAGNRVTLWHSDENLDDPSLGLIGTDEDILHVTCPSLDADCDGIPDATDNCPYVYNAAQENFDGDDWGDICDPDDDNDGYSDDDETNKGSEQLDDTSTPEHCDGLDNDGDDPGDGSGIDEGFPDSDGDTIKDCVDPDHPCYTDDDDDDDGFADEDERWMSTDELDGCPDGSNPWGAEKDDAWPPDIDGNAVCDVTDALLFLAAYPSAQGSLNYSKRLDMAAANGVVDVTDAIMFLARFPSACTNP